MRSRSGVSIQPIGSMVYQPQCSSLYSQYNLPEGADVVRFLRAEHQDLDELTSGRGKPLAEAPLAEQKRPGFYTFHDCGSPAPLVPAEHVSAGADAAQAVCEQRRMPREAIAHNNHLVTSGFVEGHTEQGTWHPWYHRNGRRPALPFAIKGSNSPKGSRRGEFDRTAVRAPSIRKPREHQGIANFDDKNTTSQ